MCMFELARIFFLCDWRKQTNKISKWLSMRFIAFRHTHTHKTYRFWCVCISRIEVILVSLTGFLSFQYGEGCVSCRNVILHKWIEWQFLSNEYKKIEYTMYRICNSWIHVQWPIEFRIAHIFLLYHQVQFAKNWKNCHCVKLSCVDVRRVQCNVSVPSEWRTKAPKWQRHNNGQMEWFVQFT